MADIRYDDLVRAWQSNQKREKEYQDQCIGIATKVANAVQGQLGRSVLFFPPDYRGETGKQFTLADALTLQSDGNYNMDVGLLWETAPSSNPKLLHKIPFQVRIKSGVPQVQFHHRTSFETEGYSSLQATMLDC